MLLKMLTASILMLTFKAQQVSLAIFRKE